LYLLLFLINTFLILFFNLNPFEEKSLLRHCEQVILQLRGGSGGQP
jgi:hypothetical protein